MKSLHHDSALPYIYAAAQLGNSQNSVISKIAEGVPESIVAGARLPSRAILDVTTVYVCDEPSVVLLTFTPKRRNRRPACSVSSTAPSVRQQVSKAEIS